MENRKAAQPLQLAQTSPVPPSIFPFLFSIFASAVLLVGCGAPGEPIERKAPTPTAVTDLAAAQKGNDVILTFTLPKDSIENHPLKQPPAIEIFRDFQPASASATTSAASATAVPPISTLLVTIPSAMVDHFDTRGQIRFDDTLKLEDFTQHPGAQAVYIVRTRTSAKKVSANSNAASLRVEPAADPVTDLQAEVTHQGVVLTWTPPQKTLTGSTPAIAYYRVYRAEPNPPAAVKAGAQPAAQPNAPPASESTSAPKPSPSLLLIGDIPAPPFRDLQTLFGKTYTYSVRSVAQYENLQVESADSNLITISLRDTFPPAVPQGLVVVFVPAQGSSPAYLDLSWSISAETDIAGYNVYRSDQEGAAGQKQNPGLLLTPAFRDMNTVPGRRYFYAVTAVDRTGNESAASATAPGGVPVEVPANEQPNP
jgi:hypothetical protein